MKHLFTKLNVNNEINDRLYFCKNLFFVIFISYETKHTIKNNETSQYHINFAKYYYNSSLKVFILHF